MKKRNAEGNEETEMQIDDQFISTHEIMKDIEESEEKQENCKQVKGEKDDKEENGKEENQTQKKTSNSRKISSYISLKKNIFLNRKSREQNRDEISICECVYIPNISACNDNCVNRFCFNFVFVEKKLNFFIIFYHFPLVMHFFHSEW